ncbi:MAG: hypothetical protein DHS20C02_04050 [Micavibrio sp.]|nr:MAG: hypothetical protein DHS20C02_04050 [Micavibrio sp.]
MNDTPLDHTALFKVMPIPRFIVQASEDDRFVVHEANKRALDYFGHSAEQVVGHPIESFMDSENARHFHQSFEVCITKKKPVTILALPTVPGGVRVNGFWVNPIKDKKDNVVLLDVIGQADVSDQSILQRERDDAISLLTSVFEVSEVGIVVTDGSGQIVRVNDSFVRIYGWSRDELINADITSLVTPDEREVVKRNYDEFLRTGERNTGEMKIIRKDGSIANALFTTAMLELSQKRRFQVTTVMDITLRKQMEQSLLLAKEQADAANMAKSTFLANMSHELRTPLNAIIGFSEMMVKETFGPLGSEKYAEYQGDILLSANHLLEIINEVLDMSKIEAGRIELDEANVDMRGLMTSVVRMMDSRAFDRSITIKQDIHKNLPNLYADPRLVRQILINLMTNAIKFSEDGDEISISAYMMDDGRMQIVVSDEGVGIAKDKIQEAMEPFGQVTEGSGYAAQGTGLGLPLAKAMVELHDGSLSLESDLGKGARVFVSFPARRIIAASSKKREISEDKETDLAESAE